MKTPDIKLCPGPLWIEKFTLIKANARYTNKETKFGSVINNIPSTVDIPLILIIQKYQITHNF